MVLTYKVKHNRDFTTELQKAWKVAEFAITHPFNSSSALVKHLGLQSAIACQLLCKYGRNKKIKTLHHVNLIVPGQSVKYKEGVVYIPCLQLHLPFNRVCTKINQVELTAVYALISVTVTEAPPITPKTSIGVDLNATGHCAVVAVPATGKVYKLGKKAIHTHLKYRSIRRSLQLVGRYAAVKGVKNRESRIVRDLNHKISKFIVTKAKEIQADIKLEDLSGIRETRKPKNFRYALNSWSFYQLQQFIGYKAKLAGVPVVKIDPAYTSQRCSRCGLLGTRSGKLFKCPACGHVENADVNAAFNIAGTSDLIQSSSRLSQDRDWPKGFNGKPQRATPRGAATLNNVVRT